ncbi:MAG: hypothetical protein K8F30_01715, partial [Taibaiella sp.]|nr:hypothetical protein [Taibaiella sp.]
MEKEALIKLLEGNLARQLSWIASADSKITFAFALNTSMLGVLGAISPKTAEEWSVVPATVALITAAMG